MHPSRLRAVPGLLSLLACAIGCASGAARFAEELPGSRLAEMRRCYVQHQSDDPRDIQLDIQQELKAFGVHVDAGDAPSGDYDAIVSYADRYLWDITMYCAQLTLYFRDTRTGYITATGCSAIPKAEAMRPRALSVARTQPWRVGVRVSGGREFEFRISDAAFEAALRDALRESGLLAGLVALGAGDYRLDVVLDDGLGVEAREITVLWSLSRVSDRATVWQELVTSRGSSHHFVGVIRNRRSLELGAQENIRLGIERLSHRAGSGRARIGAARPVRPAARAGALRPGRVLASRRLHRAALRANPLVFPARAAR